MNPEMKMFSEIEHAENVTRMEPVPEAPPFVTECSDYLVGNEYQLAQIQGAFYDAPEMWYVDWKDMTADERLDALQKFSDKIAEMQGNDTPITIITAETNPGVSGFFDGKDHIVISGDLLTADSTDAYREVVYTFLHEQRHAFQFDHRNELNAGRFGDWISEYEKINHASPNGMIIRQLAGTDPVCAAMEQDADIFTEDSMRAMGFEV